MRKRKIIKELRRIAGAAGIELRLQRQGARHEIWTMGGQVLTIPRHSDINEFTARQIVRWAREVADEAG